jgi:hypothetical protein
MAEATDDPKDLGSKKMGNQEKQSDRNEGFSGDNLPKNYDPSKDKLKTELEQKQDGSTETQQRARDVDEKKAPPVNSDASDTANSDGETVSKSRGTATEKEDIETTENRDFNNDTEKGRYDNSNPDNKVNRGNTHSGD